MPMTTDSSTAPTTPFEADSKLAASLQQILVDQVELHLQAKQAHWNLIGPGFREIHLQLDEITDGAREASDDIAERLRALGATADGRAAPVAATTTLPGYPAGELSVPDTVEMIADRIAAAGGTIRELHDGVDGEDPSSADLLHQILLDAEKQAWMLRSAIRQA
jgi:starvation-inducible DNA-binding protein